jgi:carboxylate-amine ligase
MLLDPETLDLAPRASDVLALLDGDRRFKLELPASQLEIMLPPLAGADAAADALAAAREALAEGAAPVARVAAVALHPFAAVDGQLNRSERHVRIEAEYGAVARRQLLCALQVHVAVRGAGRALAVHDSIREHLPDLAALAAAAPFHGGRDTGHASWRPHVADLLPRHGIPPALGSWAAYASALADLSEPGQWWWDVRPHPEHGTLEVRVPDVQATVRDAEAVIAVVHALVAWLAARHDAGERLPAPPTEPLARGRLAAARDGLAPPAPRERLEALLEAIEPHSRELGGGRGLARAREIVREGGAPPLHREIAAEAGLRGLVGHLADLFASRQRG